MGKKKLIQWLVIATICLLGLSSCRETPEELNNVVAKNEQLEAELMEAQLMQVKLQKDNEQLRNNIDELFTDLESMESKIAIAQQLKESTQTETVKSMTRQVNEQAQRDMLEMSGQRETAVMQVEELKAELEQLKQLLIEKDALIEELDAWIDQVQADAAESDMVLETWESDPNADLEEITDEDNV